MAKTKTQTQPCGHLCDRSISKLTVYIVAKRPLLKKKAKKKHGTSVSFAKLRLKVAKRKTLLNVQYEEMIHWAKRSKRELKTSWIWLRRTPNIITTVKSPFLHQVNVCFFLCNL